MVKTYFEPTATNIRMYTPKGETNSVKKKKSLKFQFERKTMEKLLFAVLRAIELSVEGKLAFNRRGVAVAYEPKVDNAIVTTAGQHLERIRRRIGSRRFRYRNSRHVNPITKDSFQARWESETISQRRHRDGRR